MSAPDLIELADEPPLVDGDGDTVGIEYDGRDGNVYLTVRFAGEPAPFRLNASLAADLSARLARVALVLRGRETAASARETGHEPDALCLCPAASEYDAPCPRHGVLGISVTGRP